MRKINIDKIINKKTTKNEINWRANGMAYYIQDIIDNIGSTPFNFKEAEKFFRKNLTDFANDIK